MIIEKSMDFGKMSGKIEIADYKQRSLHQNCDKMKSSSQFSKVKKSDSELLSDLLKNFSNNSGSSKIDSGNYSEASLKSDYQSLMDAMSSCNIKSETKAKVTISKSGFSSSQNIEIKKKNKSEHSEKRDHKTFYSETDLKDETKQLLMSNKISETDKSSDVSKNDLSKTIMLKVKKSKGDSLNNMKHESKTDSAVQIEKTSKKLNNIDSIDDITDKIKQMTLIKKEKTNDKKQGKHYDEKEILELVKNGFREKKKKEVEKSTPKNTVEEKSKEEKSKQKEKIKFVERGPLRCNVIDARAKLPPYEKQVHRNSLSGGKVLLKTTPPENDVIPSTVNKYADVDLCIRKQPSLNKINNNLSPCEEVDKIINQLREGEDLFNLKKNNDFYNWEEDLSLIMEVLEGDQLPGILSGNDNFIVINENFENQSYTHSPLKHTDSNLSDVSDQRVFSPRTSIDENFTMSSTLSSTTTLPLMIQLNSNDYQDPNYLTPSEFSVSSSSSLLSPHVYSPGQGFRSPSLDNMDNNAFGENSHLYETPIIPNSNFSRESYSSVSSSDSTSFQLQDENLIFGTHSMLNTYSNFNDSLHINNTENFINNSPEFQKMSNLSPISYQSPEHLYPDFNTTILDQRLPSENDFQINSLDGYTSPSIINQNVIKINEDTKSNNQSKVDFNANSLKSIKKKCTPIASKELSACCIDYKKSAKQVLEEMFNRIDDRMKQKICVQIHQLTEDKLMEYFDGQLSSWNDSIKSQYLRLPLLHATCKRLLMRSETMVKFFEVYSNGHTILDRAVLTCSQSIWVARYLAECMLQAQPHLPTSKDFILDKCDNNGCTVLHRAAERGEQCAAALAGLLSINDVSPTPIFNVNRLNSEGYSPLHIACSRHSPTKSEFECSCQLTVHVLLKHGHADPNIKDGKSGNTALHTAVEATSCAPQLVATLLHHGAKAQIRNYSGATPLDLARTACRSSSKPQCQKQVVDMLKKAK